MSQNKAKISVGNQRLPSRALFCRNGVIEARLRATDKEAA